MYVNFLSGSINGTVLGSTEPVFMPNLFDGVTNFFFATAIPVTAGVTYYFQPVLQSGDNEWGVRADAFNYPGGQRHHQCVY